MIYLAHDIAAEYAPNPGATLLTLPSVEPQVGDWVFAVGWPFLRWLPDEQRADLRSGIPLVSMGRIIAVSDNGIIHDIPTFSGNSGGPVLNEAGEVLGVLYTLVSHQRAMGTPAPPQFLDHYSVSTRLNARQRQLLLDAMP